jgi:acyl-CoA dehydrogenase
VLGSDAVPAELAAIVERTRSFVREVCIPAEDRFTGDELDPELRRELQQAARAAGVFAPHAPREFGGLGLDVRGWSTVFEEAGYSLLGPQALNCAAPDEGNMHLLEVVAGDEQKERYLRPLVQGEVRSCFAMSEPHPGAGSDPAARRRRLGDRRRKAVHLRRGRRGVCHRHGADAPGCDDVPRRGRQRRLPGGPQDAGDRHRVRGGHCEVAFRDCFVADDAVLGEVGQGFRFAQVRLGPARLTHCMRWLGLARRSLDIALDRAAERELFGARLQDLGLAQGLIADSVIDLEASHSLIRWAAEALDAGHAGRHETSVAKVFVAEAVFRVVDRAVQLTGGDGVMHDLPLARFLAEVRPFRIYDGPSETHRWAIARRVARVRGAEREQQR